MCIWAHIICNNIELNFSTTVTTEQQRRGITENDTDYARVGVAESIMHANPNCYHERIDEDGIIT